MFKISRKILISGAIGNALETYDYIIIWGLLSVMLSKTFFPPNSNIADIFALFLIPYFVRPVSNFIFGILADTYGRKKILSLSMLIMGLCTTAIAFLPGYNQIGLTSTLLLLFFRLVQVISVSGQYISSVSYLIESCKDNQKGYFGSWAAFGLNMGTLTASIFASLLSYLTDIKCLPDYAWRILFFLSSITIFFGFWIRNSIPESFEYVTSHARMETRSFQTTIKYVMLFMKNNLKSSILIFSLVLFGTTLTMLVYIYGPIQMLKANHVVEYQSFIVNSVSLSLVVILIPLFGYLSDKISRIRMATYSVGTILVCAIPYYWFISSQSLYNIALAHTLIAIPSACAFSVIPVIITEIFPVHIRCSGSNIIYSFAMLFGGGLTPIIASHFSTGQNMFHSPGIILFIVSFITLVSLYTYQRHTKSLSTQPCGISI